MTTPQDPATIFCDPTAYADPAAWHRTAATLRTTTPVARVEHPAYRPFWALTRHRDVHNVERRPDEFLNTIDSVLVPERQRRAQAASGAMLKTLVHMDGTEHRGHRSVTAAWFRPGSIKDLADDVAALAHDTVDRLAAHPGHCDFVTDIASGYPLHVIMQILGVPAEDEARMLELTQQLFGSADPEVARSRGPEDIVAVINDFRSYFGQIAEDRRTCPRDDLSTTIANGTIDGRPLDEASVFSYYTLVATAGHDTTSATLAGGLAALIDHPDQLELLQAEPDRIPRAVEEMIRWVSPVRHFMRYAVADTTIGDVEIAAGDGLLLSYLSANRDEDVFADSQRFDVTRTDADRQLGFGFGAHFCLGAHLARLELRCFFEALLPRLVRIERAGPELHLRSSFVGGIRSLPITFELRS